MANPNIPNPVAQFFPTPEELQKLLSNHTEFAVRYLLIELDRIAFLPAAEREQARRVLYSTSLESAMVTGAKMMAEQILRACYESGMVNMAPNEEGTIN